MDKAQREIITTNMVELVDNININDGLYTQLLSKKILNMRAVNRIKNSGPEEKQVEELLKQLLKLDCFEKFCEALIDDSQEHIVKKYLTLTSKPESATAAPASTPDISCDNAAPPSQTSHPLLSPPGIAETSSGLKRSCPSPPRPTVLCIKEADNKNIYIQYAPGPPAEKKIQLTGEQLVRYEEDETRYALKHYVTQESNQVSLQPQTLPLIFNNPQSLDNPNILDKGRYYAAFNPSLSGAGLVSDFSLLPQKDTLNLVATGTRSISNPDVLENQRQDNQSAFQNLPKNNQNGRTPGEFIKLSPGTLNSTLQLSNQRQYLENLCPSFNQGIKWKGSGCDAVDTISSRKPYDIAQFNQTPNYMTNVVKTAVVTDSLPVKFPADLTQNRLDAGQILSPATTAVEMDDIDLPDGCVNVKVEHTTKEFFINNHKKSYPMRRVPRGHALIINVDEVVGKPPRKGTNFDRDNLCNLLSQLHFNIHVFNDSDGLSAQDIVNKLKAFAKMKEHYDYDACFICLLSHGEEGYIFGTDGKRIPLEEIFMLFGNTNCKGLMGKPKIFIIQACRGGFLDKGVSMDEPDGGPVPNRGVTQLPSMSDMLICYPTQLGYYAWRNRSRGSWYIEAIVQVFMRYAKNEDICAMLNRVNLVVSRKISECNQKEMNSMSQMSEYKSTLRQPYLFFFPGIGIS